MPVQHHFRDRHQASKLRNQASNVVFSGMFCHELARFMSFQEDVSARTVGVRDYSGLVPYGLIMKAAKGLLRVIFRNEWQGNSIQFLRQRLPKNPPKKEQFPSKFSTFGGKFCPKKMDQNRRFEVKTRAYLKHIILPQDICLS